MQYNPVTGPLAQLAILPPSSGGIPALSALQGQVVANPAMFMALLDTGASNTCISQKVVADLNLVPTGRAPVAGVHGSILTNTYQFTVAFFFPQQQLPSGQVVADAKTFDINGTEFDNTGCSFDVLLGRDVICAGHFTLSFHGQFVLCF